MSALDLGRVKIVGTGLLGTSLGLALARAGLKASLSDAVSANLNLAVDYGAGTPAASDEPFDLVVVCVPPAFTAEVVATELAANPGAVITDVASVKGAVLEALTKLVATADLARYVGSHPMAGRERGGPSRGRADLFFGRPWVITPRSDNDPAAVAKVSALAELAQAAPVQMSVADHDQAVALVSHLPQLVASVLAATLTEGTPAGVALAGQGLRDTTRIAASDPDLWVQIISQNAAAIGPLVTELKQRLALIEQALADGGSAAAESQLRSVIESGNRGVARIPGKHGGKFSNFETVTAIIDDTPGALAALLGFIGQTGINLEDLSLEHSPGAPIGLVELQVVPEAAAKLSESLRQNGWRLA